MADFTKLKRTEDKYIVPKSQAERIKKLISERMAPSYPNPLTLYTLIKSTYFDSKDGQTYKDHINKEKDRSKIRIRTYGNNGIWADKEAYLEIKHTKQGGEKKKERAKLWDDDNTDFFHGDGKEFIDDVHQTILEDKLEPVCCVTYRREAYQDPDGFRVTFDTNISYHQAGITPSVQKSDIDMIRALEIGNKYNPETDCIMEVKHDGEPGWFKDLKEKEKLEPTSFSKFAYAMYHILFSDRSRE